MKRHPVLTLVLVLVVGTSAFGAGSGDLSWLGPEREAIKAQALKQLQREAPGVRAFKSEHLITRLYGQPFGYGSNPQATAERFVDEHAAVFGVGSEDLVPGDLSADRRISQPIGYDHSTGQYKFTLFYYHQELDGIPVYESELRLLVRNSSNELVWAASSLRDLGDHSPDRGFVGSHSAAAEMAARADESDLTDFGPQTACIYAGSGSSLVQPRTAVSFKATSDMPQAFTYVVDPINGEILDKIDMIIFEDVVGNVSGLATEGPGAEHCEDEIAEGMPYARVSIGSNYTYADYNGDFVLSNSGTSDVTVTSEMRGEWFSVEDYATSESELDLTVTPPGPADFLHNSSNTEYVRAQVNAYIEANGIRAKAIWANPSYPYLDQNEFPIRVNRDDGYCPGNAWYSSSEQSINFCESGSTYPNTAWSSVIVHEYGHRLVNAAGSGQDQYGEGMSDCMSIITLDDPRLGLGFYGDCDDPLRNAENSYQYPCTGGAHDCGQLLSGCVWDLRNELTVTEPTDYMDVLTYLTINSILLHTGSDITPQITIDFMTLDDDDGNLANGTPHYWEIQNAFSPHNMAGPELELIYFEYPNGVPDQLVPGATTAFDVDVLPLEGEPLSGSGKLHYSVDGGSYVEVYMTETSPNNYLAELPPLDCYQKIKFYFSAEDTSGSVVYDPSPSSPYEAIVATDQVTLFTDDFESDMGWTFSGGLWNRGTPTGGGGDHGDTDPSGGYNSSTCLNYNVSGDYENYLSEVHATSPAIDCSELVGSRVSFQRWLGVEQPSYDHAYLRVSSNGSSWTTIWENEAEVSDGSWQSVSYDISSVADGSATVYIRFTMGSTDGSWQYCGWNVDDLEVSGYECYENRPIISTLSLPDWTEGVAYSQTIEATGGTGTYTWADKNGDLSGTGLALSTSGVVSGAPATQGSISFTAKVTDEADESDEQLYTIEVNPAVAITTISLPDWTAGHTYSETVVATGGTGGLTFSDQSGGLSGTGLTQYSDGVISGVPVEGAVSYTVEAADAVGSSDTEILGCTVNPALDVVTTDVEDPIIDVPYSTTLTHSGGTGAVTWEDLHNDLAATGLSLGSGGTLSGTPTALMSVSFTARVIDDVGAEDQQVIDFEIVDVIQITTTELPDWTVGAPMSYELETIGERGTVTWSDLYGDLSGTGLALTGDGFVDGTPTVDGEISFTAYAIDTAGFSDEQVLSMIVNPAVQVTTTSLPEWTVGVEYSESLEYTGGTPPVRWDDVNDDLDGSGMTLSALGVVAGTPTAAGTFGFTAEVTDKALSTDDQALSIIINPAPSITTVTLPDGQANSAYDAMIEAEGGTGTLTFTDKYSELVGTGLSLDTDGHLSGTPADTGTISFTALVSDVPGALAQQALTVYVGASLTIVTETLPPWTAGAPYSVQLESTAGTGQTYWSDMYGDLVGTGLTLSIDGLLSGTPTAAGTIEFTAEVTDDGGGQDEKPLTMTVNPAIVIGTTELPDWTIDQPYSVSLSVTGGTGIVSISDLYGDLAGTGLTLSSSGVISGTPATSGTLSFTAHAEDMGGGTADQPLSVLINEAIAITTTTLPDGVDGEVYSVQLIHTGGTAPFEWGESGAGLDGTGLSLSPEGILSGTPLGTQTIVFTAAVADYCGSFDQGELTLFVDVSYLCGDANGDGIGPDIADLTYLVEWMFQEGPAPVNMEAVDVDGEGGQGDIADLIYLVSYMFQEGPELICGGGVMAVPGVGTTTID